MLKSTIFCFSVAAALNGVVPSNTTCIPLVKPEYIAPHSKEAVKGLEKLQQTFFKKPKITPAGASLEDKPTKPILIIKTTQNK
tara:strand:- start:438 stop:686 length:249 start_codon:yes stop_codon:yes gene_type:complete